MRYHPGALRTAALVAAVFVAARVVYRIVFGGASGGGALLLDLPRVVLGGPFQHVALFGPITTGGLWNAAAGALPFAAVIVAFGLVNALVDVQRLFVHGSTRGPLRAISRSLVIAWHTAPALGQVVRRVRRAAVLRGERGAAALLVPVFEQTVERALALAASMEVRGFAASAPAQAGAHPWVPGAPVVLMSDAALSHAGHAVLSSLVLRLDPGSLIVLTGPTGAGKSSLLRSLDGLLQHFDGGLQQGGITVCGIERATTPPRDTAALVGSVPQNVRLSFATATVRQEIGFALAVRGLPAGEVAGRVAETAALLGASRLLDRAIAGLSAGEATLVAIAAAVSARPALLLVDEPLAELDTAARRTVCAALDALAHEHGVCVVVAEHHYDELAPIADGWITVQGGRAHAALWPPTTTGAGAVAGAAAAEPAARGAQRHPLIEVRALTVGHAGTTVLADASLAVAAGEVAALCGPNGAGKSSLLAAVAAADAAGHVFVAGDDLAGLSARARRRRVTLVPERVDELFFHTSVAAECHRADRADGPAVPTADTLAALLGIGGGADAGFGELLLRHPRDLSAGQQLCLALAIQLAPAPDVLLVDEPSRGLDPRSRELVGDALRRAASAGRAVLFATHDDRFAGQNARRVITVGDGRVHEGPAGRLHDGAPDGRARPAAHSRSVAP